MSRAFRVGWELSKTGGGASPDLPFDDSEAGSPPPKMTTITLPAQAWAIIEDTLSMDVNSKMIDESLRGELAWAMDQIQSEPVEAGPPMPAEPVAESEVPAKFSDLRQTEGGPIDHRQGGSWSELDLAGEGIGSGLHGRANEAKRTQPKGKDDSKSDETMDKDE